MYHYPDISERIQKAAAEAEQQCLPVFREIEDVSEANQYKVLRSFIDNRVSESDFFASSGYGYNELGREKLERVYADIFHTEDALVRPQITCGTHALYLALSALLLPGDEILFLTGKPYDSLERSIGITPAPGSLSEIGVTYAISELIDGEHFDLPRIRSLINERTRIIYIQRSKGYASRKSLSPEAIGEAITFAKNIKPDLIAFLKKKGMTLNGEYVKSLEEIIIANFLFLHGIEYEYERGKNA